VRKTPSWPRSWANLHLLDRPNDLLAAIPGGDADRVPLLCGQLPLAALRVRAPEHGVPLPLKCLECQVPKWADSDTCPRPTTSENIHQVPNLRDPPGLRHPSGGRRRLRWRVRHDKQLWLRHNVPQPLHSTAHVLRALLLSGPARGV
jgi:hypothetical protein